MDYICLAQDKHKWRDLVSTVMDLGGATICNEFMY